MHRVHYTGLPEKLHQANKKPGRESGGPFGPRPKPEAGSLKLRRRGAVRMPQIPVKH